MKVVIIGATGLVGAQILKFTEASSAISAITTLTRRKVEGSTKLNSIVTPDTNEWTELIAANAKDNDVFFSAFGTTRADAGGIENFKKIDYGTNLQCAKAAKDANISTFVLVSSAGANSSSWLPYLKIKGELEDEITKLGFKRFIILRPGALLGQRTKQHNGFGAGIFVALSEFSRKTPFSKALKAVYAEEIGKAVVSLATKPLPSNGEPETRIIEAAEIVQLASEI
ncbi:protein Fmp52p, mitochondrial [[Candida] railenensis]|uniref:Protein Fmp52p, mitochondrial n=1 Tax=[Candida] railenensis TaxID=45579 RepID=A0A9P0QJ95_9ASCO|nr:protein Fmp52p, mitochondrial [[Candida] railenensis]